MTQTKTNTTIIINGITSKLDLLVKPTPIPYLFLIGGIIILLLTIFFRAYEKWENQLKLKQLHDFWHSFENYSKNVCCLISEEVKQKFEGQSCKTEICFKSWAFVRANKGQSSKHQLFKFLAGYFTWGKGISFGRNCGAASVGKWYTKIWFINGVDNVNWPPYRDWKVDVSSVSLSSICSDEGLTLETSAFRSLYGGQFTLSTLLINQIFVLNMRSQLIKGWIALTTGSFYPLVSTLQALNNWG